MSGIAHTRFWKRFRKNKLALVALFFISFFVIIALFAYLFSPDGSKDANRITLEIQAKAPGFSCYFFSKNAGIQHPQSNFSHYLNGYEIKDEWIPIRSWSWKGDSLILQKIIDEQMTENISFYLPDVKNQKAYEETHLRQQRFLLGTDNFGRDVLSRLLIGSRVSLSVGLIAVLISMSIGIFLGAVSGYFGGWTDQLITWFINVIWAIPTLLLVFAITFALGKGFWQIFIAVGLTMWVGTARLIRGQVLSIKELDYVKAARTMGFSSARIIFRHILPNVLGPTLVMAAANFATAILIEAGLSFLGIGVQPPTASWGLMIKENYHFIITNRPMLAIVPGFAIMLTVLAFNILGNALRDALDVKSK
jgi:peptide/nickel transport system permease protein